MSVVTFFNRKKKKAGRRLEYMRIHSMRIADAFTSNIYITKAQLIACKVKWQKLVPSDSRNPPSKHYRTKMWPQSGRKNPKMGRTAA